MRIRTIAKNCEAKRIRTKWTRLRFAFASQFLKRVRFRFAFAIGTDCEFAEQNLRKIHSFQNIFHGLYGVNFNVVLFSNQNIALKIIICSDNIINPFLLVNFRRIRVFGDYFGFPVKLRLSFNNFVGLPTIAAKINVFSEIFFSNRSLIQLSCVFN